MVDYILGLDKVEIDVPNSYGFTPFLIACKKNNIDIVKSFLNHKKASKININAKSSTGDFPLFYATHYKNVELVKLLLDHHADMYNEKDADKYSCYSAFIMSCSYFGTVEIMKLFLDHGVDVNRPNSIGIYPLSIACKSENVQHVRVLLEYGANPNVQSKTTTPLVHTCVDNTFSIAKELIDFGADVNCLTNEGIHPLIFLMNERMKHNNSFIQFMIDQGADLYCKDNFGSSLLYILKNSNKIDKEEVYDTLISAYKHRNDYRDRCHDTTSFIETYDMYKKVMALLQQEKDQEKKLIVIKNTQGEECSGSSCTFNVKDKGDPLEDETNDLDKATVPP